MRKRFIWSCRRIGGAYGWHIKQAKVEEDEIEEVAFALCGASYPSFDQVAFADEDAPGTGLAEQHDEICLACLRLLCRML